MSHLVIVTRTCSYCDPANPSVLAKTFMKGDILSVPEKVSESLATQMFENGDLEMADESVMEEFLNRETKVEGEFETKDDNPFAGEDSKELSEMDLDELRAEAERLDIEVDNRWKEARLIKEIEEALEAAEESEESEESEDE